jgi:hypothetical protein
MAGLPLSMYTRNEVAYGKEKYIDTDDYPVSASSIFVECRSLVDTLRRWMSK